MRLPLLICFPALLLAAATLASAAGPSKVTLQNDAGNFTLLVDGQPFWIKGVGGGASKTLLKQVGGNAYRTWGAENLGRELDEAQKLGLKVVVGIWLDHERKGGSYADPQFAKRQLDRVEAAVKEYKDHPAVLMWAVGNEMEGYGTGDSPAIWKVVEQGAAMAKKMDPNHPTMTVIAEVGGGRVKAIHEYCPSIDVIGINSYGGAASVPQRYRAAGGTKPYALTEFGTPGHWEVGKTAWDAPIEPTSTFKATFFRDVYEKAVEAEKGKLCLGSFAFLWGHKQERTMTWFSLLLPDGARVGSVDVLQDLWTGKPAADLVPTIASLTLDESKAAAGATLRAILEAADPEGEALATVWELRAETTEPGVGGDPEKEPRLVDGAVTKGDAAGAEIKLPDKPGPYRLFVEVKDGHGGAATANVPLLVTAKGE